MVGLMYAALRDSSIPNIVNCSCRYDSIGLREKVEKGSPGQLATGSYIEEWRYKGKVYQRQNHAEEIYHNSSLDISCINRMDPSIHVLTCHGTADTIVSLDNPAMIANELGNRHTLCFFEGADHNFKRPATKTTKAGNFNKEVSDYISNWLSIKEYRTRFYRYNKSVMMVPRWKSVEGVNNFRDLGGYQIPDGRRVRPGWIFRCANLANITEAGLNTLKRLNVTTCYDLRSGPEIDTNGYAKLPGIKREHVPIFESEDYSPEALARRHNHYQSGVYGFVEAYTELLDNAGPAYKSILLHIRDRPQEGLLIHCTAGKDRTGLICAIILSLAGIDETTIALEYSLTTEGLAGMQNTYIYIYIYI